MLAASSVEAEPCRATLAELTSDAMFARYPAKVSNRQIWRAPDVRTGQAHLFRTVLRTEGTSSPDFAGHYLIVRIGCGAGTICPAFLDRANGHVSFPSGLRSFSTLPLDFGPDDAEFHDYLTYRLDSRLLVVLSNRNEDERTTGATLYDWRDDKLHLIRFIPKGALCMKKEGS
jgi:hypothetical protein